MIFQRLPCIQYVHLNAHVTVIMQVELMVCGLSL